jgi:hypothetical protein
VREHASTEFNEWLHFAMQNKLKYLVNFVRGWNEGYEAVMNAPRFAWGSGQLEGGDQSTQADQKANLRAEFDFVDSTSPSILYPNWMFILLSSYLNLVPSKLWKIHFKTIYWSLRTLKDFF